MNKLAKKIAVVGREELTKNYMKALKCIEVPAICTLSPEEAIKCDGLILPGGGDIDPIRYNQKCDGSYSIDEELDIIQFMCLQSFLKNDKPVLGICRGMQAINVQFGGTLVQNINNANIHCSEEGNDLIHCTCAKKHSYIFNLYGETSIVNSAHHQAIDVLGEGLEAVQWADNNTIEAIAHFNKPIIGVQWHPERICFGLGDKQAVDGSILLQYFVNSLCSKEQI